MELFSEVYSCYFTAMRKVLETSHRESLTYNEVTDIISKSAYTDSGFYIMPYLASGEWRLLKKEDTCFRSELDSDKLNIPMTHLQRAWLKSVLTDKRMALFLDDDEIRKLSLPLEDAEPLYESNDFHFFDAATDGDPYANEQYIKNFRNILSAIKSKSTLLISYDSGKGKRSHAQYMPLKLNYSEKDDKFRLVAVSIGQRRNEKVILNLSRIKTVTSPPLAEDGIIIHTEDVLNKARCKEPVVLQILQGRNALERVLLQFSSIEKQTEYDEATNTYTCKFFYDRQDETELLIRILSFGPVVKVLGPESFLRQIRSRIKTQMGMDA